MDPLIERLKDLNGGKILDVATGHGEFLDLLAGSFNDFEEAVGIDISGEILDAAQQRFAEKYRFEVMDAERIGFRDGYFDTVAIRHSLHHLKNPDIVLKEMKRVLKPDGLFIICEIFQSPDIVTANSQRHLHHWWAEVDRAMGKIHNENLIRAEILDSASSLNFESVEVFEYLEEFAPGREKELLESMLRKCDDYIKKLLSIGEYADLIDKGNGLLNRFKGRGFTAEKFLYILGRK